MLPTDLDRHEPIVGPGDAAWKILGKDHRDPLLFGRGRPWLRKDNQPTASWRGGHRPSSVPSQALVAAQTALPAPGVHAMQQLPDFAFRGQVAVQRSPLVARPPSHQTCGPLGTHHAKAMRIVEIKHGERQIVMQATQGDVTEASLG
ncbi:MAG: hypothetical protein IPI44_21730 [Sulfuritalea sp.]|nr:hypothetical protein [Sulfuritalea sp.]